MKKKINYLALLFLAVTVCFLLLSVTVHAATDTSRSFNFELRVNGGPSVTALVGDEIGFEVELQRVDDDKSGTYSLYSMQDELIFDSRYFTFVEGSQVLSTGVDFNIRTLEDGYRKRIIISRLVMSQSGATMSDVQVIAAFKLRTRSVIQGEQITSKNYKVNTMTGDTYVTTGNDVTVTVTGTEPALYAVLFEGGPDTNGTAPSVGAWEAGAAFELPVNTFRRDGYIFIGWNDGSRIYEAGDLYTMPGRLVTFTAQWEEKPPLTLPTETVTLPTQPTTVSEPTTTSSSIPQGSQTPTSGSQENPSGTAVTSSSIPQGIQTPTSGSQENPSVSATTSFPIPQGGKASTSDPHEDPFGSAGFKLIIDRKVIDERRITVEERDEGIHLWGDDLKDVSFQVGKAGRKARLKLDTDEKEVIIKEMPDGSFEVWIDKDGDGVFDTSIARATLGGMRPVWWLVIGLVVLSAAGLMIVVCVRRRRQR